MSKRRFDTFVDPSDRRYTEGKSLTQGQRRVEGLLDNSKTTLCRSLKVARGFERQKLGRRQKAAKLDNNEAELARLRDEVIALKNLDLSGVAEIHLFKSLLKTKSIASSPAFPQHVRKTVEAAPRFQNIASTNVQARLFNSTPVKSFMIEMTCKVRSALSILDVSVTRENRVKAVHGATETYEVSTRNLPGPEDLNGFPDKPASQKELDAPSTDSQSDGYSAYSSRIAKSSYETSGANDHQGPDNSDWPGSKDIFGDRSDPSEFGNPQPRLQITRSQRTEKATSEPPKSTTFLPALSMSGYWSGSGSDSDQGVDEGAGGVPARKNRRGQRARQRIAEMKYKENANHLKKQAQNRDAGWDARKGARNDDQRRRGKARRFLKTSHGGGARSAEHIPLGSGANSDPVKPRTRPILGQHLHPSWEAAKKAKEQKMSIAFHGKKMVFD